MMSLEAAIGQIDQILTLRQQLLDPASAASATSPTASTSSSASSASATSFADMLADAEGTDSLTDPEATIDSAALGDTGTTSAITDPISSGVTDPYVSTLGTTAGTTTGLTGLTGLTGATGATATSTSGAPAAFDAMVQEANSLVGKPYVWGGGHSGWGEQPGYDCSGFVSAVLHAGGVLASPQDTQTLPSQAGIEQGPGQYVTIYDRTDGADGGDHVIIDLGGQFYESGGGHGAWGGGGGVEKIATPSPAYLSSFNLVLHPEGM